MGEEEREALNDYVRNLNHFMEEIDLDDFRDKYQGQWDSEKDFAEQLAEEWGWPDAMEKAGINWNYFDADAYAADLFIGGDFWISENGHVFRNQ